MPSRGPSPEQPRPFRSGPIGAIDFALFGPAGPASDTLNNKKDPSKYKESKKMEPSGLEPLTPCMPCSSTTGSIVCAAVVSGVCVILLCAKSCANGESPCCAGGLPL